VTTAGCGRDATGYSLVECVVAMALAMSAAAYIYPFTSAVTTDAGARQAAGFMASRFRLARQGAALGGAARAVVFDFRSGRWVFRVCTDGNGNGVRRLELANVDECDEEPFDVTAAFRGVRIDRDPSVPDPGGGTPSADPVRFGSSDIATFSPAGSGTAGTLYLLSVDGAQYAVRVSGFNGRTRVLRYDRARSVWREI